MASTIAPSRERKRARTDPPRPSSECHLLLGKSKQRLGIALPEWTSLLHPPHQFERDAASGDRRIDHQRVVETRGVDRSRERIIQKARKSSIRPRAKVTPAAIAWPPPLTAKPRSTARRTAEPRSTPLKLLPEPVPSSPLKAIANAGVLKRSFKRDAISPTTPGCQSPPCTTRHDRRLDPGDLRFRLAPPPLQRRPFDRLALAVEPVQLEGDAARLRADQRGQEPRRGQRRRSDRRR